DIFDARRYGSTDNPHTFAARNSALRASLRCRSMRGYYGSAAPQLTICHPGGNVASLRSLLVAIRERNVASLLRGLPVVIREGMSHRCAACRLPSGFFNLNA
ncbi:hypothetical protein, partial [uncultured Duncaniella sp.]|uniref:hypothetical protein n=2 Tax=uncultured Duncaniella sp. TaxID=2768039 RepID=UPI00261E0B42